MRTLAMPGRRLRRGLVVALACTGLLVGSAPVSFADPPPPVTGLVVAVGPLSASQGQVEVRWTAEPGSTYTVLADGIEVSPTTSQTYRGDYSVGKHSFELERTTDGQTDALIQTVTVPTAGILADDGGFGYLVPNGVNAAGLTLAGSAVPASVSPDRAHYVAGTSTGLGLFDLDGTLVRQLTDDVSDTSPAISPDGRTLAFVEQPAHTRQPGPVYLLDLTNPAAAPALLAEGEFGKLSWTPDGGSLIAGVLTADASPVRVDLVRINVATGAVAPIAGTDGAGNPAVSRTGRLAYDLLQGGPATVVVSSLDGSDPVTWSPATGAEAWVTPEWDPTGSRLAMVAVFYGPDGAVNDVSGPGATPTPWRGTESNFAGVPDISGWVDVVDQAPRVSLDAATLHPDGSVTVEPVVVDPDDAVSADTLACRVGSTSTWTPCLPAGWRTPAEPSGNHTLEVRATDPAGQSTTATYHWVVHPAPYLKVATPTWSASGHWVVTATATSQFHRVAWVRIRRQVATGHGAWGHWSVGHKHSGSTQRLLRAGKAGTETCFEAKAADNEGHVSGWSTPTCTSVVIDDRALRTPADEWSKRTDPAAIHNTLRLALNDGVTLSSPSARIARAGVFTRTGPTQGGLLFVWHGNILGPEVSLTSPRRQERRLFWRATASKTRGSIELISDGPCAIDGLVLVFTRPGR